MIKDNWFRVDGALYSRPSFAKLRSQHGHEGVAVYFGLLHLLRAQEDYTLETDYATLAFMLCSSDSMVESVVKNFGLFYLDVKQEIFYDMSIAEDLRKRDTDWLAKALVRKEKSKKAGEANAKKHLEAKAKKQTEEVTEVKSKDIEAKTAEIEKTEKREISNNQSSSQSKKEAVIEEKVVAHKVAEAAPVVEDAPKKPVNLTKDGKVFVPPPPPVYDPRPSIPTLEQSLEDDRLDRCKRLGIDKAIGGSEALKKEMSNDKQFVNLTVDFPRPDNVFKAYEVWKQMTQTDKNTAARYLIDYKAYIKETGNSGFFLATWLSQYNYRCNWAGKLAEWRQRQKRN